MSHSRYMGKSLNSTGYRLFKNITTNGIGKMVLISWMQRRCVRCKRFLGKKQKKYCSRCEEIMHRENSRIYSQTRYWSDIEYKNKKLERKREQYRIRRMFND